MPADTDAPDVFAELAVLKGLLREIEVDPWHHYTGTWLAEFFFDLRFPRKIARIVDAVFEGRRTRHIVAGPRGGGKCLSPETPVLMHDGTIRRHDQVRPGDLLMGPDSTPRRVIEVHSGEDEMYRVTPTKGSPYTVNSRHVLSVRAGSLEPTVVYGRAYGKGEVAHVPVTEYAALPKWKRERLPGWRTGVEFPARPVPLSPYFLGLWLGDGDSHGPTITTADPEIAAYLRGFAEAQGLNFHPNPAHGRTGIRYSLRRTQSGGYNFHGKGGNPITDTLRMLGICRHVTAPNDLKRIPPLYLANSREVRLQVLAGLVDSDGFMHHGGYEITTIHPGLADDICFLARSLGYAAYSRPRFKTIKVTGFGATYHTVTISGDLSEVPVLLARKKAPPRRQIKDHLVTGLTVTPVGVGPYVGFTVDGDHQYLLGDFTVVHNSFSDAFIELLVWLFRDYDVINLGGSEIQAQNVHAYFKGFLEQYRQTCREFDMGGRVWVPQVLKDTMEKTLRSVDPWNLHTPRLTDEDGHEIEFVGTPLAKDSQAFVAVLAATEKRVRGPHAGSERRGGLLVVDEEGEVAEDIFDAAKYTVNTAKPSVILRTSTYHNALGTFGQDFEDPDAKGFERHRYSIFDVAKTCPYAKTTPAQWEALRAGAHRVPGDDHRSVLHLPVLSPDCTNCPHPEYFRDARFRTDPKTGETRPLSPAWCAGAAAFAEHGWVTWDEIDKLFRERPNDEDFEVELLGFRPTSAGYVIIDRDKLRACAVPDEECRYDPLAAECVLTIDWGLTGTCAVHVMQNHPERNQPYGERWVFRVDDLGHAGITRVGEHCADMRERYGCQEVWSDASHPYENHYLATELGFDVHLCYFAKMKEHGAGSINGHVEHDALKIAAVEGKPLLDSLNSWRRDKNGQIVKKNDHHADSLLCGAWRYYDMVMFMVAGAGAEPRRAQVANAAARSKEPTDDRPGSERWGEAVQRVTDPAHLIAQVSAYTGARPGATLTLQGSVGSESQRDVLPPNGHSLPPPPEPLTPTRTEQIIAEQADRARQSAPPRRFR